MNTTFKAVVFDLDGTLVDSRADLAAAANRVLERNGWKGWPEEQYNFFIGHGLRHLVKCALEPYTGRDEDIDRIKSEVLKDYSQNYAVKTAPYPGILNVLDSLAARGIKTAILSNKPHGVTLKIAAELFAQRRFDAVQGGTEHLPLKPDPQGLLGICRRLGVEPAQVLYVGDSGVDVETARNANVECVYCAWGYGGKTDVENCRVIKKAEDILGDIFGFGV